MISFANSPGLLFNRLGKIGLLIRQLGSYQASQLVNMTDTTNGVVAQFNTESDIQAIMGSGYLGVLAGSGGAVGSICQTLARQTANRVVYRDNPRLGQTLTSDNTLASLQEIIRQMKLAGATVLAMTITGTPIQFTIFNSNIGNGVINYSVKRGLDGLVMENTFAEQVQVLCIADSYSGSAIAGNEGFTVTGQGAQNDLFAFNYPLGSNCQAALNVINANANVSQGNILQNSGFGIFANTPNVPDSFTLDVGVAGTNVAQETTLVYGGASALKVIGDGTAGVGTYTQLSQLFGAGSSALGTTQTLSPLTQYSLAIWARRDAIAAANGQWVIELVDQNGVVINDQAGVPNTITIDLTALTVNYAPYTMIIRTPKILSTSQSLRMRMPANNALTTGRAVYFDTMGMGLTTQLYNSGPSLAIHSGSVPFAIGDYGYCTFTNSRGAGNTLNTFQTLMARLFPAEVMGNQLLIPSSSVPNVADALIG